MLFDTEYNVYIIKTMFSLCTTALVMKQSESPLALLGYWLMSPYWGSAQCRRCSSALCQHSSAACQSGRSVLWMERWKAKPKEVRSLFPILKPAFSHKKVFSSSWIFKLQSIERCMCIFGRSDYGGDWVIAWVVCCFILHALWTFETTDQPVNNVEQLRCIG